MPIHIGTSGWREDSPRNFLFSVKASRFNTHNKKLKDSGESFRLFFDRIRILGNKLRPVLFQLPPNWKYNGDRLEEFLASLPAGPRFVFEFRNPTWVREEAFALLERFGAAYCMYDMAGETTPIRVVGDTAYIRFHGEGQKYGGRFRKVTLEAWAERMRKWSRQGKEVFAYFNNDLGGAAPIDAKALADLLKLTRQPVRTKC